MKTIILPKNTIESEIIKEAVNELNINAELTKGYIAHDNHILEFSTSAYVDFVKWSIEKINYTDDGNVFSVDITS